MGVGRREIVYAMITERMVMRCLEPSDAPSLYALAVKNAERLGDFRTEQLESRAAMLAVLRRARADFDLEQIFGFHISLHGDPEPIGSSTLDPRHPEGGFEITGWFDADQTSKGYAFEGSAALTKLAFEHYGARRVEMYCDLDNRPVHRLLERLGYRHEATLRRRVPQRGELRDRMIWVVHDTEYPGTASSTLPMLGCDALGTVVFATDPAPKPPAGSPWGRDMATWQAVLDHLGRRYQLTETGPTSRAFPLHFSHRSAMLDQRIDVRLAGVLGQNVVVVHAPVGPEADLGAREALAHSATLAVGSLCLFQDTYHLRHSVALEGLTPRELDRVILLVGHEAARLRARARFGAEDAEVYAWAADGPPPSEPT